MSISGTSYRHINTVKRRALQTVFIFIAALTLMAQMPLVAHANPATWTANPSADESIAWNGIAWSPDLNLFVAVGTSGVMTSPDGVTWTMRNTTAATWTSVAWSPELHLFVAVASS